MNLEEQSKSEDIKMFNSLKGKVVQFKKKSDMVNKYRASLSYIGKVETNGEQFFSIVDSVCKMPSGAKVYEGDFIYSKSNIGEIKEVKGPHKIADYNLFIKNHRS